MATLPNRSWRPLLAIGIGLVLLVASCTGQGVQASLERSTSPLLVPKGEWRNAFEFTAPPGATDLYQLRWNFSPGATDAVTGWQVGATSTYEAAKIAEGPGQELVDEALRASRGENCTVVENATDLLLCAYEAPFYRAGVHAYLVRSIQDQIVVVDYNNLSGDPRSYNPDALAARFITADFEAVPIDGSIDDYLVTIF